MTATWYKRTVAKDVRYLGLTDGLRHAAMRSTARWLATSLEKHFVCTTDDAPARCTTRDLDELPPDDPDRNIRCANCLAWDIIDNLRELFT